MKRTLLMALGFGLLSTNILNAADNTDFVNSVHSVLGYEGTKPLIQSYYDSYASGIDDIKVNPDKLATIYVIGDIMAGSFELDNVDDIQNGADIGTFTVKLASMEQIVRDSYGKIDDVKKKIDQEEYSSDKETKELLKSYLAYQKALTDMLNYKNAVQRAKLFPEQQEALDNATKNYAEIANNAKKVFESKIASYSGDKEKAVTGLKLMQKDLEVSKPVFQDSDVVPPTSCDPKKVNCAERAKKHLSSVFSKGRPASFAEVEYKKANSCVMDKVAKAVGSLFNFGQVFCERQIRRNGIVSADGSVNNASVGCLSAYKNFGNPKDTILLNPYINKLNNVGMLNLQLLAQNTSMNVGGFSPNGSVFNSGSNGNGGTGGTSPLGNMSTTSSINTGNGVTQYSGNQAVTSFYNPATTSYNNMASGAKTFISSTQPVYNNISSYNNVLSSAIVSANPKISQTYNNEVKWATSTLNKVKSLPSGTATTSTGRYDNNTNQMDRATYLRLEFSRQQDLIYSIIAQQDTTLKKLNTAKFLAMYGSESVSNQAAYDAASYEVSLKMLQSQGTAANKRLGLLMATLGRGYINYNSYSGGSVMNEDLFNIYYMYADNSGKSAQRALKLDNLKTPVSLSKNWESDFKAYIDDMSARSSEARKAMDDAKVKIRKLLSEKLPVVDFNKLPQPGEVRDELINMRSLKQASLKNIEAINKAMAYRESKKDAYTKDQYANYKTEQTVVDSAMTRMVNSINVAEKPVSIANDLVRDLYKEVPRAEALKVVARQMVEQGL